MISFGCWTAVFSLFAFVFPDTRWLSIVTVATSVSLAIIAAYVAAQDYKSRALRVYFCYLELQRLSFGFDSVDAKSDPESYADRASERYIEILHYSENHTDEDYLISEKKKVGHGASDDNREKAQGVREGESPGKCRTDAASIIDREGNPGLDAESEALSNNNCGKDKEEASRNNGVSFFRHHMMLARILIATSPLLLAIVILLLYCIITGLGTINAGI